MTIRGLESIKRFKDLKVGDVFADRDLNNDIKVYMKLDTFEEYIELIYKDTFDEEGCDGRYTRNCICLSDLHSKYIFTFYNDETSIYYMKDATIVVN